MTITHFRKFTLQAKTKKAYLDRAQLLINRYKRENNRNSKQLELDNDFIEWLIQLKPTIRMSTWRQYKASVIYYLNQNKQPQLIYDLKPIDYKGCIGKSNKDAYRNTSSHKKKSVNNKEEKKIVEELNRTSNTSYWSKPTLAFFKATLAVGLRPGEWENAELTHNNKNPILKVKNGKNTNGRSHGKYRHIHLQQLTENDLIYIKLTLLYANPIHQGGCCNSREEKITYEAFYRAIRYQMYKTCIKLFPGQKTSISLYSCRHQLIANLKAADYTPIEIAAIVGHGNDITAGVHYGRKKAGRPKKGLPVADQEDIEKVTILYARKPNRIPKNN